MTLTTRLSLFSLTMLGVVLAGFSATLYLLARDHLQRQAAERLDAAMNILVAAAEVGPEGVEWEPAERHLNLSQGAFGDQVVWSVSDGKGQLVDRSGPVGRASALTEAAPSPGSDQRAIREVRWQGGRWQVSQQWIRPPTGPGAPGPRLEPAQPGQAHEPTKHPALAITAGMSLEPLHATLRQLAAVLVGLSLGIWLTALFLGRAISRRALRPVNRMASSARAMDAADLGQRLPTSATGDELEELARAFNGLLDRLQESFERQRRFSGDASHQLRNPLAAMLGQMEVALRRERTSQEYQRVLTAVHGQALHLRQIVEALLFLARADAEARLSHTEGIDMVSWLCEHLQHWSDHPRSKDLRVDLPPDQPSGVLAQEPLLSQLVDILIENASKYSLPGSPITLRLGIDKSAPSPVPLSPGAGERGTGEGAACLAVEDRGWGIAPEDLAHVFEPFYRAADVRRHGVGGVGLGLAIAERIATALGGRLSVTSEPGQGSCFTLRLPLAPLSGVAGIRNQGSGVGDSLSGCSQSLAIDR